MNNKETDENAIGTGKAGPGRPKGSLNKSTVAVKTAIVEAAEGLGGTERLIEWAKSDPKNETAFWVSIYPKLLPKEMTGADGAELFPSRVELVAVEAK